MIDMNAAFDALTDLLQRHSYYDLAVGLEYSSVTDWTCDITPRRRHAMARRYGEVFVESAAQPADAICKAVRLADDALPAREAAE